MAPPGGVSKAARHGASAHVQWASYSGYKGHAAASCSPSSSCGWVVSGSAFFRPLLQPLLRLLLRPLLAVPLGPPGPRGCCWGRHILGERGPGSRGKGGPAGAVITAELGPAVPECRGWCNLLTPRSSQSPRKCCCGDALGTVGTPM